jgi:D-inositol-3-phosphate glycosyltransferase
VTLAPYAGPSVFGYETDGLRRVAQVSLHTSPLATLGGKDAGGMNVYVRDLACHLAATGLAVDVFTRRTSPDAPEQREICPGVTLVNITAGPPAPVDKNELFPLVPEFAAEMALYSLREGVRYDAVHAHYWLSGWAAHLVRRYWDTPFIQMFHTTAHMKNAVSGVADRESGIRLRTERHLLGLADGLIAANPDERADLIWRLGTPADKICTVPPGVDLTLFQPQNQAACRHALDLPRDRPIILFVGRVDPIKGIETLLEVAALMAADVAESAPPLFLFIGGDLDDAGEPIGPLAGVRDAATALGVADRFHFVGSQPQNELPCFYGAADLVAVPSRYESFGLVAVEAMACGTPVVASRVGGLRYTIEEGVSGLLVPHSDPAALAAALAALLSDDPRRLAMAASARAAAERFAWPAVASSIRHVYHRLAAGHRARLCHEEEIFATGA